MTDAPRRRLTTLSHLNRPSATVIALQLATGATIAALIFSVITWLLLGSPGIAGFANASALAQNAIAIVILFGFLLLMNLVGLAMWRLFNWVRYRLARRSED